MSTFRRSVQTKVTRIPIEIKVSLRGAKVRPIWKYRLIILYYPLTKAKARRMERVKFEMEFLFKASPTILYKFLTTPATLTRWFCDEVDIQDNTYTFYWSGYEEVAYVLEDIEEELLRLQWDDAEDEEEYLEFRISESPVTGETILEITDFCDEDEVDDQRQYWENQMAELRKETGG